MKSISTERIVESSEQIPPVNTSTSEDKDSKIALFIDIDGTTIVQEIDHYPRYAWKNPQSTLRTSLIDYLRCVCDQKNQENSHFDIIICTARPQMIESLLRFNVGTKPTNEVQDLLTKLGCKVTKILRTSFRDKQLKGRILADFLRLNPKYKEGILLDDQKIQKDDIEKMKCDKLKVYDINSAEDMDKFIKLIGYSSTYTPQNIIAFVINNFRPLEKTDNTSYGVSVTDEEKIQWLKFQSYHASNELPKEIADKSLSASIYSHKNKFSLFTRPIKLTAEIKLILKIIDDLALMFYEASINHYDPKLDQITRRADFTRNFLLLLENDKDPTIEYIEKAKNYFEKELLRNKKPNSMCDKNMQELLNIFLEKTGYVEETPAVTEHWNLRSLTSKARRNLSTSHLHVLIDNFYLKVN